jgi:hypothetical protein
MLLCGVLLGKYFKSNINLYAVCQDRILYWKKDKYYKIIETYICPITGVKITMINEQGDKHSFPYNTIEKGEVVKNAT